jgi:hypothetical protein
MSRTQQVEAVTAAARALDAAIRGLDDQELLAMAAALEDLNRVAQGRCAAVAAEVQWRSRPQLRDEGLAARQGERDAVDLLIKECRISVREARRRIAIGSPLAPRLSLTGEEIEGRFPVLAAAVTAGAVPLDSARIIVDTLSPMRRRVSIEDLRAAEAALTEEATRIGPDLVQTQAVLWALRIDQDGAQPSEQQARADRAFRWGGHLPNGARRFSGVCPAEEQAEIDAALSSKRKGVRFTCDGTGEDGLPEWHEAEGDQRTSAQLTFDTVLAYFRAGVRSEADGTGGSLRNPHEVVTLVTAEDLERRQGGGQPMGVLARFSLPTVERLQCGGAQRLSVTGAGGEPLWLGRPARLFTAAQKKVIAARDGGCAWPGCRAPISWCDAHHVKWYVRDRGRTDVDNGVALCSHHHHVIHSTTRWEIRMHHRLPHLVPMGWQGPPLDRHRMQRHPVHSPPTSRRM